ncbi:MAG: hypothetical protein ACKPKO_33280, partial [Candidatus Fonsibacter sp.]
FINQFVQDCIDAMRGDDRITSDWSRSLACLVPYMPVEVFYMLAKGDINPQIGVIDVLTCFKII